MSKEEEKKKKPHQIWKQKNPVESLLTKSNKTMKKRKNKGKQVFRRGCFNFRCGGHWQMHSDLCFTFVSFVENIEVSHIMVMIFQVSLCWMRSNIECGGWNI
ncbi:hypothetical protein QL285_066398 [Trifolium repens]|nr:hypothetical protein QL285_066398 [Trifolium repens]